MTCRRCKKYDAIPGNRLGFCEACETWRLKMLESFTPRSTQ